MSQNVSEQQKTSHSPEILILPLFTKLLQGNVYLFIACFIKNIGICKTKLFTLAQRIIRKIQISLHETSKIQRVYPLI